MRVVGCKTQSDIGMYDMERQMGRAGTSQKGSVDINHVVAQSSTHSSRFATGRKGRSRGWGVRGTRKRGIVGDWSALRQEGWPRVGVRVLGFCVSGREGGHIRRGQWRKIPPLNREHWLKIMHNIVVDNLLPRIGPSALLGSDVATDYH